MARKTTKARRGSPWKPPALADLPAAELNRLKYVVVEESIDKLVGLLVCDWPRSGAAGQPAFGSEIGEEEVVVDRDDLQQRLSKRRIPKSIEPADGGREARQALRQRDVAVGDVFALTLAGDGDPQEVVDKVGVRRWIRAAVDLSAEGRESAKAATFAALTPPLSRTVVKALRGKRDEAAR